MIPVACLCSGPPFWLRCAIRSFSLLILLLAACNQTPLDKLQTAPSVSIETPTDGAILNEGVAVILSGIVVDNYYKEDMTALIPTWAVNGARVCPEATIDASGRSSCETSFDEGTAGISFSAVNPDGLQGVAEISVTVNHNDAPTATILSPEVGRLYYGDYPIEFLATASDTEDSPDELTVSWESSLDGTLPIGGAPTSDGQFSASTTLSAGNHFLTLLVTDSTGRTAQDTVSIEVAGENSPPSCGFVSPASGSNFDIGETILFEATAGDADIDASDLTVTFTSDKDGQIGALSPTSSGSVQFGYSALSVNTHTITINVTDEVGEDCSDSILVAVGNAPDVQIVEPLTGYVANIGDRLTFSATVSDVEDRASALSVDWTSSIDGLFFSQGASSDGTAEFSYDALTPGTHTIVCASTDTDGLIGQDSITLYVNVPPEAPLIEITPDPAGSDDTLRVTITQDGYDADGDTVSYTYVWYQNGNLTAYTSNLIPDSATVRGDVWDVVVTPTDGFSTGTPAFDSITVGNGAPTVASVSISPGTAYTDSTLTAVPSGWSDPDGDAENYLYQWSLNGTAIAGATDPTLSGTQFVRADQLTVSVTAWDGADTGNTVSSGVLTISNAAPTAPGVSVTPERPETDDTLTCNITASTDADGDAITYTYAWTNNGSATGITTNTVPAGNAAEGDVWVCTVTPSDGTTSGASASDSVIVDDYTAPSAPYLSGIDPYRNEDTVTVYGSSEAFASITLYISNGSGITTTSTTANGAGSFTFSLTLTRGLTYTFYATAADTNGNTSGSSNLVSTEACTPWDEYEDTTGYGDSGNNPIIDWGTLTDAGSTTLTAAGNIIQSGDSDWFAITTSDQVTSGINYYNFHVELTAGSGHYAFVVYDGGYSTTDLDCGTGNSSDPEGAGYTEYNVYQTDRGDAANHAVPGDTRTCYDNTGDYNNCTDFSTTYWVHIIRTDGGLNCSPYELTITNGVW